MGNVKCPNKNSRWAALCLVYNIKLKAINDWLHETLMLKTNNGDLLQLGHYWLFLCPRVLTKFDY